MAQFYLNEKYLKSAEYQNALIKKINFWEERYNMHFDEHGRIHLGLYNNFFTYTNYLNILKNYTYNLDWEKSYLRYFRENDMIPIKIVQGVTKYYFSYMRNEYLTFKTLHDFTASLDNDRQISITLILHFDIILENKIQFLKKLANGTTKIITMKYSKFIAKIHDLWLETTKGQVYAQMHKKYKADKHNEEAKINYELMKSFSWYLLYLDERNFLSNNQDLDIYFSVNPVDNLHISGAHCSKKKLTNFNSCMATDIIQIGQNVKVTANREFSNPIRQLLLNYIPNRGMLFITNGKTMQIPNADIIIFGYFMRVDMWATGNNNIHLGRMYPNSLPPFKAIVDKFFMRYHLTNFEFSEGHEAVKETTLDLSAEIQHFMQRDKHGNPIYLDKVAISEDEKSLYYLENLRSHYENSNTELITGVKVIRHE